MKEHSKGEKTRERKRESSLPSGERKERDIIGVGPVSQGTCRVLCLTPRTKTFRGWIRGGGNKRKRSRTSPFRATNLQRPEVSTRGRGEEERTGVVCCTRDLGRAT